MRPKLIVAIVLSLAIAGSAGLLAGLLIAGDGGEASPDGADQGLSVDLGDVGVIVWLERDVTEQQRSDLEAALTEHPDVESFTYFDRAASVEEFNELFADNQEMLDRMEARPDLLPTSYRIVPVDLRQETVDGLVDDFEGQPGVQRVSSHRERALTLPEG